MAQYKTVAGPVGLTITRKESYSEAVKSYAAIIDKEAVGGWVLDSIQDIPVTKKNGCIASLLGQDEITMHFNMLIFRKDD